MSMVLFLQHGAALTLHGRGQWIVLDTEHKEPTFLCLPGAACLGARAAWCLCSVPQSKGAWEQECHHACTLRCAMKKALLCSSLCVSHPQRGHSLCNFVQGSWKGAGRGWRCLCLHNSFCNARPLSCQMQESAWRCSAPKRDGRKGFTSFTAFRALRN